VDEVIPLMAEGKILPYLDIPFQHASPRILKAMRRPANQERVLERLTRWRQICPDLAVRSTFIVGFPGETDEDFTVLLEWLKEARLERVGCFKYEPVAGAKANEFAAPVGEDIKEERWHRFMRTQQQISADIFKAKIGRETDALIDAIDEAQGIAIARSPWDAPEIDGNVLVPLQTGMSPGDMIRVRITGAEDYDLIGELL
jgi:ribosomal protein S12 methylthiotransferase